MPDEQREPTQAQVGLVPCMECKGQGERDYARDGQRVHAVCEGCGGTGAFDPLSELSDAVHNREWDSAIDWLETLTDVLEPASPSEQREGEARVETSGNDDRKGGVST